MCKRQRDSPEMAFIRGWNISNKTLLKRMWSECRKLSFYVLILEYGVMWLWTWLFRADCKSGRSSSRNSGGKRVIRRRGREKCGSLTTFRSSEYAVAGRSSPRACRLLCPYLRKTKVRRERAWPWYDLLCPSPFSLELYKPQRDRSAELQAGPLQRAFVHPRYLGILEKCIREPFIAHMGHFDETEFCLWMVTEVEFHPLSADKESEQVRFMILSTSFFRSFDFTDIWTRRQQVWILACIYQSFPVSIHALRK